MFGWNCGFQKLPDILWKIMNSKRNCQYIEIIKGQREKQRQTKPNNNNTKLFSYLLRDLIILLINDQNIIL